MLLDLWFHHTNVIFGGYVEDEKPRRIPQPIEPWRPREDEEALLLCDAI